MNKKIRVAIYARVSTKHEAQMLAFENQVEWYKRLFERYPEWELIDMSPKPHQHNSRPKLHPQLKFYMS